MSYTPIYKLYYLDPNTNTQSVASEEFKRWNALDTQIFELYSLFGNGVLSGWEIEPQSNGLIIFITPGTGHVAFKSAVTTDRTPVTLAVPPDSTISTSGIKYYIYGKENQDTNIQRSIDFISSTNLLTYLEYNSQAAPVDQVNPGGLIRIGEVVLKTDPNGNYIIETPTYETRDNISLFDNLSNYIKNHIHIGGVNNPSKVNLYRHVTGKLSGDLIDWLDASIITKGIISQDRMPKIKHDELEGVGSLTHTDIDNIILAWSLNTDHYLNDVAMSNQLKLTLSLKHIYETIDEVLDNTILYIPGMTTQDWEDQVNTTAIIDRTNHIIYGYKASAAGSNFIAWNTKNEFQNAADEYNINVSDYPDDLNYGTEDKVTRSSGISINDFGVELDKVLSIQIVHDNIIDVEWTKVSKILGTDNSKAGPDGLFKIDVNFGYYMFKLFTAPKGSALLAQDWSGSTKMQFAFTLESNTADYSEHGDIYMFLIGANPSGTDITTEKLYYTNSNGVNDSIIVNTGIKIISDGELTDGAVFIDVDLSQFPDLDTVAGIGFYTTTQTGWNPQIPFDWTITQPSYNDMNTVVANYFKTSVTGGGIADIDKSISIYRYNDNIYQKEGYILLRFNTPTISLWDYIYLDTDIPSYSGTGTLPNISVKTRVASTESALFLAQYKETSRINTTDLYTIGQPSSYWIDIKVSFTSSGDKYLTPLLKNLTLYYTTSSESNTKSWASYSSWFDYQSLINIDISQNPDKIGLLSYNNAETRYFFQNNIIKTIDNNDLSISSLVYDGSELPLTPIQVFFGSGTGFIAPSQLSKLDNGNYLIADSGNDRVLELDASWQVEKIFQGNSYLGILKRDLMVLTATYNSRLGQVAITFSQIVPLQSLDLQKFVLVSGTGVNKVILGSSTVATARMLGGALQGNIAALDGTEWQEMPSIQKDTNGNITSYDMFDVGSETQTGTTIIPGIGKSGSTSVISNNLGTILLFDLKSAAKAQVNSWAGEKKIKITAGALTPGNVGGIDSTSISASTTTAQWFDAEVDANSDVPEKYTDGLESNLNAFNSNYNPYIISDNINIYPIPEIQTEDAGLGTIQNIYSGLPYSTYTINDIDYYITEPRYNLPQILIQNNSVYEYPIIEDRNKFYSDLKLTIDEWNILINYDESNIVNSTILKDPLGNDTNLELNIDEFDIIYWDILNPVSVQKTPDDQYIIAQANKYSIINIDINGSISWTILDSVVNYAFGDYGTARLLENGNLYIVSSVMNLIAEIEIESSSIVDSIYTKYGPIDAIKESDGVLVLVSQKASEGMNSRAYKIDLSGEIIWEWGLGRLKLPSGIERLSNDNILISC